MDFLVLVFEVCVSLFWMYLKDVICEAVLALQNPIDFLW